MDSDSDNGREWDPDNGDGVQEAEAMDFIFEQATTDEVLIGYVQSESPGKTKYWVPTCDESYKPYEGMKFPTVEAGMEFYKKYGSIVGFDARRATQRNHSDGTVNHKYMICHREGYAESSKSTGKRKRYSNRVGCNAHIILKFKGRDGYVITHMEDRHTHPLMQQTSNQFLKAHRKLDFGHQRFMIKCARANLGPAMTHRLMKENSHGHVGPLLADLKNFKRDIMAYISGADAQMVIDRFMLKQKSSSGFFFAYDVDENKRLVSLFWCDPIARANYAAFGDVVSFDSTYRTNKYSMVFAPFTGLDNNHKSITFGAGLLLKENIPSYKWMFENFQKAMTKDPTVIVTDQDPAMKEAIKSVFPNTHHRFCMWHIMMKVPREVPKEVCHIQGFRKKLSKAVWSNKITVEEFEAMWEEMLSGFSLTDNNWLTLMYNQREYWIPAYFRDFLMGGLIRTTSISESANSFFGRYSSRHFSLVELMMHFDSAMDTQRHAQAKLDMESDTQVPVYETRLRLERHASSVYTLKVFTKVQHQIVAAINICNVTAEIVADGRKTHRVEEEDIGTFDVTYDLMSEISTCPCNKFNRIGIPCKHIFATYKYMGMKMIPTAMILPRWTKKARQVASAHVDDEVLKQCAEMEAKKLLINRLWGQIYSTVGLVEDNTELLNDLLHALTEKQTQYKQEVESGQYAPTKEAYVEKYVGVKPPNEIVVYPPPQAKNKGTRLKSSLEKATEKAEKSTLRKWGRCRKMVYHDKRNCRAILKGKSPQPVEADNEDEWDDDSD